MFVASNVGVNPLGYFRAFHAFDGHEDKFDYNFDGDHSYCEWTLKKAVAHSCTKKALRFALNFFFGIHNCYKISPSMYVVYSPDQKPKFSKLDISDCSEFSAEEKQVLAGGAISEFQVSGPNGTPDGDWAAFARNINITKDFLLNAIKFNKTWKVYIDKLFDAGIKHFRFSIDWSQIEPVEGEFDLGQLQRYKKMVAYCKKKGMSCHATLMHFNKPQWWAEKGGFENADNINAFVWFCTFMVQQFGTDITDYYTINEPTIDMFMGYVMKEFPPFKTLVDTQYFRDSLLIGVALWILINPWVGLFATVGTQVTMCSRRAATVLKNQLQAHCEAYKAMKSVNPGVSVGICHQALEFESRYWFDPIGQAICFFLSNFTHHAAFSFFETGVFDFWGIHYEYKHERGDVQPAPMDVMGLQKYANCILSLFGPTTYPAQEMTSMGFPIYPESLWQSLKEFSSARSEVRLQVTENGAPTEESRDAWLKQYPYIPRAFNKEGGNIDKYFLWSVLPNIEWTMDLTGTGPQFPDLGPINFNGLEQWSKIIS
jgi:beta-glucosidase